MNDSSISDIEQRIGKYFCQMHNIDTNAKYELEYIPAIELLTSERLDLIAKIKWLNALDNNDEQGFYRYLYREHIKAITGRTEVEGGQEEVKNSLEKFEKIFNELRSIKKTGLDPNISIIPVANNNVIMDGAHRTAAGIVYNKRIPIVRLDMDYPDTSADFFLDNLMNKELVEYMVNEYCKITKKNVYAICLWPKSYNKELRIKTNELIDNATKIIYKKEIDFNYNALRNFIIQIYSNFNWLGGLEDHFAGASDKAKNCWKEKETTLFYFVEGPDLNDILKLKSQIRELYNIGNDSVHITDNNDETVQIANLILNNNSIDLLKNGTPDKYKEINILINEFKNIVNKENMNLDDFIIDSSGIIAIYGLREANDLDFLSNYNIKISDSRIDKHNSFLKYHNNSLNEILYNPKNYLYYNNVKFITLNCARDFKINRGEKKDMLDVKLIDSVKSGKISLGLKWNKLKYDTKRYFVFYFRKFKMYVKKIKFIAPIYELIKRLFKR